MAVNGKRKSTIFVAFLIVVLISGLTLLRENIFLEINAVISGKDTNQASFYFFHNAFVSFEINALKNLKWVLTILFSCIISLLSVYCLHIWFKKIVYTRIIILVYIFIAVFIVLFGLITFMLGSYHENYFILRKMIGFLQSPLPLIVFFTTFYYISSSGNREVM